MLVAADDWGVVCELEVAARSTSQGRYDPWLAPPAPAGALAGSLKSQVAESPASSRVRFRLSPKESNSAPRELGVPRDGRPPGALKMSDSVEEGGDRKPPMGGSPLVVVVVVGPDPGGPPPRDPTGAPRLVSFMCDCCWVVVASEPHPSNHPSDMMSLSQL